MTSHPWAHHKEMTVMPTSEAMETPLHEWISKEDLLTRPRWHFGPPAPTNLWNPSPDERWTHQVLEGMDDPADFTVEDLRGSQLLTQADRKELSFWYLLLIDRCWGAWGEANDPRWAGIVRDQTGAIRWAAGHEGYLAYIQMLVTVGEFVLTLDGAVVQDQIMVDKIRKRLAYEQARASSQ